MRSVRNVHGLIWNNAGTRIHAFVYVIHRVYPYRSDVMLFFVFAVFIAGLPQQPLFHK